MTTETPFLRLEIGVFLSLFSFFVDLYSKYIVAENINIVQIFENKLIGFSMNSKNREAKRARFVRIAERRVNKILNDIDSLGKTYNRRNYEYGEEDVRKIFSEIESKVKEVKLLFKNSSRPRNRFKLEP